MMCRNVFVYRICSKAYDQVYVTFSGIKGHNYGNIMELLDKINYKKSVLL